MSPVDHIRGQYQLGLEQTGKYSHVSLIAAGGVGAVFRATRISDGRVVAAKVMRKPLLDRNIYRLDLEEEILKTADHPQIPKWEGSIDIRDLVIITQQCIDGKPVGSGYSLREGLDRGISLATAMIYLHEKLRVASLDLKHANVLEQPSGEVVVVDFGIARKLDGCALHNKNAPIYRGRAVGSPMYISPESCNTSDILPDERSDIYMAGVLLYDFLSGKMPFTGGQVKLIEDHLTNAPKSTREHNKDIPKDVDELVLKCLRKRKDDRFQSARALKEALEKLKGDHCGTAK